MKSHPALIEPIHVNGGKARANDEHGTIVPVDASRATQAFRLIRGLLRHHKRLFFTAVGCAAVFAACTSSGRCPRAAGP